jgi:hypothetical protein
MVRTALLAVIAAATCLSSGLYAWNLYREYSVPARPAGAFTAAAVDQFLRDIKAEPARK